MVGSIKKISVICVIWIILVSTNLAVAAADYAREQRWADEVTPGIVVGEAVYLKQKNRHQFLAIYSENAQATMGLVIVHGMGIHPDWGMINTLRQDLVDEGFTTLSIQMPVLAADADFRQYPSVFDEAAERLQLSVAYLKNKGYQRVAIVSHSNGSRMSRVYMAQNPKEVNAWAALSLTQGDTYAGINAPILDLYGAKDLPHVIKAVEKRKASFKNSASKQIEINDCNHFFNNHENEMVKNVSTFLKEHDKQQYSEQKRKTTM